MLRDGSRAFTGARIETIDHGLLEHGRPVAPSFVMATIRIA